MNTHCDIRIHTSDDTGTLFEASQPTAPRPMPLSFIRLGPSFNSFLDAREQTLGLENVLTSIYYGIHAAGPGSFCKGPGAFDMLLNEGTHVCQVTPPNNAQEDWALSNLQVVS